MAGSEQLGLLFQPQRRIWTVRDLIATVRTALEREYTDVWVEGEISNFRPAESGHLYLTLKDGAAQLRVVIFRSQARLLRFRPDNGLQVIARGRVTVYEGRGELQLTAEYLEPKGAGALQVAYEQLKAKLAAEGLFDASRKKPLPLVPRRIGVVTSPRGAAIQDILNILRRRHETVHVLVYPAQVQGEAAPSEVSAGIRYFNRAHGPGKPQSVDVIIVARGGGSVEDLAAFNNEGLARTIAASKLPVISAVGHETDFTISDFVADLRAPTPSAAAELVIRSKREVAEQVEALHSRLGRAARYHLLMFRQRLTELAQHGAFARMQEAIGRRSQRLDDLVYRLAQAERQALESYRRRFEIARARLEARDLRRALLGLRREAESRTAAMVHAVQRVLLTSKVRLEQHDARLQALSPLNILERGYALVFDAAGTIVKRANQVNPGELITAHVAQGVITAEVEDTKP
jgi:exodeoxyribonuclease VII large subunit